MPDLENCLDINKFDRLFPRETEKIWTLKTGGIVDNAILLEGEYYVRGHGGQGWLATAKTEPRDRTVYNLAQGWDLVWTRPEPEIIPPMKNRFDMVMEDM